MRIGELAERTGVPAKTVRYYEEIGLISSPTRTEGGYRDYSEDDVHVLRFLARARGLGFSVADCRDLLALWQDRDRASADVKRIALGHIAEIDDKLAELKAMRATLSDLAERCRGNDRPSCPILEELSAG